MFGCLLLYANNRGLQQLLRKHIFLTALYKKTQTENLAGYYFTLVYFTYP